MIEKEADSILKDYPYEEEVESFGKRVVKVHISDRLCYIRINPEGGKL